MAKTEAPKSLFSVYYQAIADDSKYQLVTRCDNVDVAIGVALNLHQLSNCPHEITVEGDSFEVYLTLYRYDYSELKLQSNGR